MKVTQAHVEYKSSKNAKNWTKEGTEEFTWSKHG